jgi:hypothetical protein
MSSLLKQLVLEISPLFGTGSAMHGSSISGIPAFATGVPASITKIEIARSRVFIMRAGIMMRSGAAKTCAS